MNPIFAKGNKKSLKSLIRKQKEAERDGEYRVAKRIHAIILSIQEHSSGEIAKLLMVNRTRVPVWINNWNKHGVEGLLEGYRSGRHSLMDSEKFEKLADIIDSGPVAYGLDTGIWNSIIITKVINEEFGIKYHPGHVRKILKALGFSIQRPTIKLVQANSVNKNKWIRYTYPLVKKKHKKKMV